MANVTNMATMDEPEQEDTLADPQQTEPATHSVLMRLREMIVTGKIAPDSKLRAEALATLLDVSRTPIRSALAVLSAEGLVKYSVNRGYTVRAVTVGDVFDSIEVRATLEGMAARAAVELGWEPDALQRSADLVAQARTLLDGTIQCFLGHRSFLGLFDHQTQVCVGGGIGTVARSNGDFLHQFAEDLALGIGCRFFVFNLPLCAHYSLS